MIFILKIARSVTGAFVDNVQEQAISLNALFGQTHFSKILLAQTYNINYYLPKKTAKRRQKYEFAYTIYANMIL